MISSNTSKYNNEIHASLIINNFCKWNLQTFIHQNHLGSHPILENFSLTIVQNEYATFKFIQSECLYIDPLNKGHLAILRYLHNCLDPNKGFGYSLLKIEQIGMKLKEFGHKNLTERPTRFLIKQLELWGLIHRTRLHRRSSYHTYLTTRGYICLVDNHKKPVKKAKIKYRK